MANLVRYNVDTAFTQDTTISTNLSSLGNTGTAIGAAITNGTNLALLADVSLSISSFTPAAPSYLEIHIIPISGDGSTYADFFAAGPTMAATAAVQGGASAKVISIFGVPIPPDSFKFGVVNSAGATLGSSSIFKYRLVDYTVNG